MFHENKPKDRSPWQSDQKNRKRKHVCAFLCGDSKIFPYAARREVNKPSDWEVDVRLDHVYSRLNPCWVCLVLLALIKQKQCSKKQGARLYWLFGLVGNYACCIWSIDTIAPSILFDHGRDTVSPICCGNLEIRTATLRNEALFPIHYIFLICSRLCYVILHQHWRTNIPSC